MNRRSFVKNSCIACLGYGALFTGIIEMSGCASIPVVKFNEELTDIVVPKSKFSETDKVIVRPLWMDFDILLVKVKEEYHALLLKCTHQDQPLTVADKGLVCSSHGSTFGFDGEVQKEPALKKLTTYLTQITDQNIIIKLNQPS